MSLLDQRTTRRVDASRALAYLPGTAFALDLGVTILSVSASIAVRQRWDLFHIPADADFSIGLAAPVLIGIWIICIALRGGYSSNAFDAGTDEFQRITTSSLLAAGVVGVSCYLLMWPLSRGFFIVSFAIGIPALLLGRVLLRGAVVRARRRGLLLHSVIIVGAPSSIDDVAGVLRREKRLGYQITGALTPSEGDDETPGGLPVLGRCAEVSKVAVEAGADTVFFVDGGVASGSEMRQIAWDFEHSDIRVVVAPSVSEVSGDRVTIRPVGGLPLIHIDPPRSTDASRWGKRVFDIAGSTLLLIGFAPLLLIAAVRVGLHDRGGVLFRQSRVGRHGNDFACLKFRTMVAGAEAQLSDLHAEIGHDGGLFKMKDDPRITKPGNWLRRFSIDELPQLWNVLRGDMSLVGPRPPLPDEVEAYDAETARRLHVRPGLTGLWQVSGRSDLSFEEAIRLDLYYVDNWSMFQDLSILLRTLGAVVGSKGAY